MSTQRSKEPVANWAVEGMHNGSFLLGFSSKTSQKQATILWTSDQGIGIEEIRWKHSIHIHLAEAVIQFLFNSLCSRSHSNSIPYDWDSIHSNSSKFCHSISILHNSIPFHFIPRFQLSWFQNNSQFQKSTLPTCIGGYNLAQYYRYTFNMFNQVWT